MTRTVHYTMWLRNLVAQAKGSITIICGEGPAWRDLQALINIYGPSLDCVEYILSGAWGMRNKNTRMIIWDESFGRSSTDLRWFDAVIVSDMIGTDIKFFAGPPCV